MSAIETRTSTCNRDCPDACRLVAEVEAGRLVSLKGDPRHPVTRGFLCFRTSHFPERLAAPDRVTQPLRRGRDGVHRPVSWDEAMDLAAGRLLAIRAESGPAAIFHYRSGGSLGILKSLTDRLFEAFGPCATKIGDICSGAGEAAQEADFGVSDSNDFFDLRRARHVVVWGKNPFVSSVHLVPLLKEVRAKGASITFVDPVRHKGVGLADEFLSPVPGRDPERCLAVLATLRARHGFDPDALGRCRNPADLEALVARRGSAEWARLAGVPHAAVERLADLFADGPTAILVGWGMQRRRRGGATVRLLDALSAVSGNLFRPGGGCSFYYKRRAAFAEVAQGPSVAPRTIREPMFGPDVLAAADPPVRAIWVTAGNPVCMLPDSAAVAEAFERTEFVVVVDPFLTDTARLADLVLPVPTLLEDDDLVGAYGHHWIGESRPLVDPPPGVRHEVGILQDLAARLGVAEALEGSVETWKRKLLEPVAAHGVTLETLRSGDAVRSPDAAEVLFGEGRVATADGKVALIDDLPEPEDHPDEGDDERPLWLFSNSTEKSQAAQWARDPGELLPVTVHPDAVPADLVVDEECVVESAVGRMRAVLRTDPALRPDVAVVPKGGHHSRGQSANALIRPRLTDLGGGAALLDCRVRLLPAAAPAP